MKKEVKNCLTWLANTLAAMYVGKQINEVKIKHALDKFYKAFKKEKRKKKKSPSRSKPTRAHQRITLLIMITPN